MRTTKLESVLYVDAKIRINMNTETKPFGGSNDPLYNDAVLFVKEHGKASTSMIQRRFQIGYNRAAYMLEAMVGTVIDKLGPDAKIIDE